jgi:hypothetical protein
VELAGFEPASKHIPHKISTCLFRHYLSGKKQEPDEPTFSLAA